jgi:hypothetical protein
MEGWRQMNVLDTILRARACCARVPDRNISERTRQAYADQFARMLREGSLDPVKEGIARNTYNFRRAALLTGGKLFLERLIAQCMAAGERSDAVAATQHARELLRAVERIEVAFDLEPPLLAGASPFGCPAARWRESAGADRERGANSKKHSLGNLPEDWDARLWEEAAEQAEEWAYLEPLAVHVIAGVRPEELVAGQRPSGWSPGVIVELRSARRLAIAFTPAKSHQGLFGTELTTITVDPVVLGGPAAFLAEKCRASQDNRIVVSIQSKDAVRKAIMRLGRRALPEVEVTITPYVLRHQRLADLKATFGGGEEVAAAAGHCTDRTQAHYGSVQHGRKLKGYISITAARPPRCGNVERARQLSRRKVLRRKK